MFLAVCCVVALPCIFALRLKEDVSGPTVPGCDAWNPLCMKREVGQTGQCKAVQTAALARSSVLVGGHTYGLGHVLHNVHSDSAVMYINVPKVGSNTLKHLLGDIAGADVRHVETRSFGQEICEDDRGNSMFCSTYDKPSMPQQPISPRRPMFYFSFVRDPLDRFISAFFELHKRDRVKDTQWGQVGMSPFEAEEDVKKMKEAVRRAEALVAYMENASQGTDEHLTAQTVYFQRRTSSEFRKGPTDILDRPQDFEMLSLDYLGQQQCLTEGLVDVIDIVNEHYHDPMFEDGSADIVNVSKAQNQAPTSGKKVFWEVLPGTLRQRICDLYWVDYCCLKLPVPAECKLKSCPQ